VTDDETRLAGYFARYTPATAALGRALRAKLRARLPGLSEVVYFYEGRGSLVISYSPTGKGYDGLCSLALYPDRAHLYFSRGAELSKADPGRLLQGKGKGVRHVVLHEAGEFDRAEIEGLMAAALDLAGVRVDGNAKGEVILRTEAQKKRAKRAGKPARTSSARRSAKQRG
jgi:hypothetical protein